MNKTINEAGRKKKSAEETTLSDRIEEITDDAEKVLDNPTVEEDPDEIFTVLDDALKISRRNIRNATKVFERTGE